MKYLLIALLFISCSPQKRMQRLIKKHPYLISEVDVTVRDTVHEIDTFFTPIHKDTFLMPNDTIIETEKLIVERFRDRFRIEVKQDTLFQLDTIHFEKIVNGKVIEVVPKWVYTTFSIFLLLLFVYIVKKI